MLVCPALLWPEWWTMLNSQKYLEVWTWFYWGNITLSNYSGYVKSSADSLKSFSITSVKVEMMENKWITKTCSSLWKRKPLSWINIWNWKVALKLKGSLRKDPSGENEYITVFISVCERNFINTILLHCIKVVKRFSSHIAGLTLR